MSSKSKTTNPAIIVLGGGVSGLAAALELAEAGKKVILLEKSSQIGGAAASLDIPEGRKVPMGYHQIVGSDQPLIKYLEKLQLLDKVKWKRTSIGTLVDGNPINLASPLDVLGFRQLPAISKVRYLLFGARCLVTKDWSSWENRSVTELITRWADETVLDKIFRPLIDIKFGFSTDEADAAWLGKRLSHREGATPFGYIPNASWTFELCQAFEKIITAEGGQILTNTAATALTFDKTSQRITSVTTDAGVTFQVEAVVSTLPPPILVPLLNKAGAPPSWLSSITPIEYISTYSLLAGVAQQPFQDYWTIFLHPRQIFGGCFTISILNETLVTHKDAAVINVFTNVPYGKAPWSAEEYAKLAERELQQVVGRDFKFNWVKTALIPFVSPVFKKSYQNPPSHIGKNVFLAGIYKTYPRLSSTGEAMADGRVVAQEVLNSFS